MATGTKGEDGGSGGVAATAVEAAAEAVETAVPTALLLLVVGEPFTEELKETIVERITKELSSWDNEASGVDLNEELQVVAAKAPIGEDGHNGEKIVQHISEKLHAVFLINPTLKTLTSKLHDFLLTNGNYRQLIYSGQVLQHSGCWILQDGVFTLGNLAEIFRASAVSNAQRQRQATGVLQLNVFTEGDWTESHLANFAPQLQVHVNPPTQAVIDSAGLIQFGAYLCCSLKVMGLKDLLQSSNVVGNIRFNRPTLYVFPSCQGDSALFGISGFNLLINGGFARKACFWDFTRHLDRIDAMLLTHLGIDNLFGIQAVVARKAQETLHPEIGYVYMNAIERGKLSPDSAVASGLEGKKRNLILSVGDEASSLVEDMKAFGLYFPRPCTGVMQGANIAPINLYHKVGHGTLDMYILNPMQDSKALKEFLMSWSKRGDGFTAKGGGALPLCHAASVCALLLWKPASSPDPVTRILFPGNATQGIIFEGLDRLKNVAVFQHSGGVEKDSRAALAKKVMSAKPQATKPTPGKTPAPAKQEPKKAPLPRKELQKGAGVPAKSEKTSDVEKKSTPSSESKSPVDLKQLATSPEATSVASEGATSEGGCTPDQEDNKENERGEVDADLLVDVQSVPSPVFKTYGDAANVRQEKPGPEEKDVDTKEGNTGEGAELQDAGGFDDVSPEGLPLPADDDDALVRCSQPDENHSNCHSSGFDPERETDGSVELFDPKKHWGIPMDLPAPSKLPGKSSSSAKGDEAVGKKTSSTKPLASQQMGHRREPGKSEEPKDEDKGKGGGDTSRKSSAAGIRKSRLSAAPNEINAKVEPKSVRASAKKPAVPNAVPASKALPLKPVVPFYVDLTYIPGHGNSHYTDIDFFRRIRARYYVLSTVNPDAGVLTALLEAKQLWDNPELETTIIPTYDADILRCWMAAHRDRLNQHRIDVAPSANRCSIQLQDHETSCAAYRLEF